MEDRNADLRIWLRWSPEDLWQHGYREATGEFRFTFSGPVDGERISAQSCSPSSGRHGIAVAVEAPPRRISRNRAVKTPKYSRRADARLGEPTHPEQIEALERMRGTSFHDQNDLGN